MSVVTIQQAPLHTTLLSPDEQVYRAKETFDRRIAFGMIAIMIVGGLILSWPGEARFAGFWPAKHSPSTARAGADVPNGGRVRVYLATDWHGCHCSLGDSERSFG